MIANGRIQLYTFLRLVLMLALGVWAGESLLGSVPAYAWLAAAAGVLAAALCLSRRPVAQSCVLMSAFFFIGGWCLVLQEDGLSPAATAEEEAYEAVITSRPMLHGKVVQCDMMVLKGRLAGRKVRASFLCMPFDERALTLRVGDGVAAVSRFEQPGRQGRVPSRFNYPRWLKVQGFSAVTFVYYNAWHSAVVSLSAMPFLDKVKLRAALTRDLLVERCRRSGLSGQVLAVVSAMTFGEKSQLSADTKSAYSVSGASHVLALSGFHLGIIYTILSLFLAGMRRQWLGQVLIVVALWTYVVMVGMMPSVVRSATMFSCYAAASLLRRPQLSLNALAFAAFVILLASPLSFWDVGFQMSFMAVAGIMVLFNPVYHAVDAELLMRFRVLKWAWAMVVVSLSAQAAVAPLVLFYFGRFSCYFLITNFIAVPFATVAVYASLFMLVSSPVPMLHAALVKLTGTVIMLMNGLLSWVARLPGASIEGAYISVFQVFLAYVLYACLYVLVRYAVLFHRSAHGVRLKKWD